MKTRTIRREVSVPVRKCAVPLFRTHPDDVLRDFTLREDYESIRTIVKNKITQPGRQHKNRKSRQGVVTSSGRWQRMREVSSWHTYIQGDKAILSPFSFSRLIFCLCWTPLALCVWLSNASFSIRTAVAVIISANVVASSLPTEHQCLQRKKS